MKQCTKCRQSKPLSAFNKKRNAVTGRCKLCLSHDYRAAYKNKPQRRTQVIAAVDKRRRRLMKYVDDLKSQTPCADCGARYPSYVMDFDHRDGTQKVDTICRGVRIRGWGPKRLDAEIRKCEIVCANCHRERTHGARP